MKRRTSILTCFSLVFLAGFATLSFAATEQVTITTYYPAPYGIYHELRADQMAVGSAYRASALADGNLIVAGNVGIGTASPSSLLTVNGATQVIGTGSWPATGTGLTLLYDGTNGIIQSSNRSGSVSYAPLRLQGSPILFWNKGTEIMRVDTTGNVGIGTTSPNEKLEIDNGMVRVTDSLWGTATGYFASVGQTWGFQLAYNRNPQTGAWIDNTRGVSIIGMLPNSIVFYTGTRGDNDTEKMRVDTSGNVGIGTTTPAAKLDVAGYVKVADESNGSTSSCNSSIQGAVRYNASTRILEYCNGSQWRSSLTSIPFYSGVYTNNSDADLDGYLGSYSYCVLTMVQGQNNAFGQCACWQDATLSWWLRYRRAACAAFCFN
jgi:hypothetical protein